MKGRLQTFLTSRRIWWVLPTAAALALCAIWLGGFGRIAPGLIAEAVPAVPNQTTALVLEESVPISHTLVGTVQSVAPVDAASRVAARVTAVTVHAGERVKRGAILVELDSADLRAQAAQAAGELAAARAEIKRTRADYQRFAALVKRGSVTAREYDQAEAAYRAAAGNLARSRAALEAARAALTYATVRAPVDGTVIERMVEAGDMALPGKPLVRLYNQEAMRVEVEVPEDLASEIAVGTPLQVAVGDDGLTFSTRVNEIVPAADPSSRSFRVRAPLPSDARLKPGMFARAWVEYGAEKILSVPRAAVKTVGQLATVQVVANGAVQLREVALGRALGNRVEVLAGLKAGDRVIVAPSSGTGDGRR